MNHSDVPQTSRDSGPVPDFLPDFKGRPILVKCLLVPSALMVNDTNVV
jgi:hypothetical protein